MSEAARKDAAMVATEMDAAIAGPTAGSDAGAGCEVAGGAASDKL